MSRGILSVVVVAATLSIGIGCKGSEEVTKTDAPPPPPAEQPATTATAAASGEVASYPTQVVAGGTVTTPQNIKVYQAADPASTLLTTLGPGTLVETKARYGDWMLINWPSGVGKLSPGWVQSAYLMAPKVIADAGADAAAAPTASASSTAQIPVPTATATATAAPTATASATATTKVRPIIKLPTKK